MDGIRYWIEAEGAGHWFFLAFPVILLALFIWLKGRRVRFLIPSLLISLVIINPLFYQKWDELGLYAYWRILWVVPVISVVAGLVPSITERINKSWIKAVVAVAGVGLVILGGTFLYSGVGGSFVEAANAAKLPDYVAQIADRLLELDEHPRVIVQDPIGVYIRQYTGEITTLYGRDIGNSFVNTPSYEARVVHRTLSNPEVDNSEVAQLMIDDEFDYLVFYDDPGQNYELIDTAADYGIYRAVGKPRVLKKRNELGEVVSITNVDEFGKPALNTAGYATVDYEYDNNGYISVEKYRDAEDSPVVASSGYTEVHKTYDSKGRVIREEYFDTAGVPMTQPAGHVAVQQEYGDSDNLISRTYLDTAGNPMNRIDGYAKAVWNRSDDQVVIEIYDQNDNRIDLAGINLAEGIKAFPNGWSEWMTPEPNTENYCFVIGAVNLGEKNIGDTYTCQVEIEFKDVEANEGREFRFASQGRGDGSWKSGSIWNSKLVWKDVAPEDGVYRYTSTIVIEESTVNISFFELGFRCDNWSSGSFRVRNVMIEKGDAASQWIPGV